MDLVVSVGGDGTALSASHYLSASVPLLGVNSDPCDDIDNSASINPSLRTDSFVFVCTYCDVLYNGNIGITIFLLFQSENMTDERRSYGALCMCNSTTLDEALPKVCLGLCLGFVSRQWYHLDFYYCILLVKVVVAKAVFQQQQQKNMHSPPPLNLITVHPSLV